MVNAFLNESSAKMWREKKGDVSADDLLKELGMGKEHFDTVNQKLQVIKIEHPANPLKTCFQFGRVFFKIL